jgi:hypothetical protein
MVAIKLLQLCLQLHVSNLMQLLVLPQLLLLTQRQRMQRLHKLSPIPSPPLQLPQTPLHNPRHLRVLPLLISRPTRRRVS